MRPPRAILLMIVLAALTAACSGGDSGTRATDAPPAATAAPRGTLIFGTTTSTYDSGLVDDIVPVFEEETGIRVITVSGGSGQIIELASRGDADVILTHSPSAEIGMVARSDGIERAPVMHNDFVIVGPDDDAAAAARASSPADAMVAIAAASAPFISRGDDSGTHVVELALWRDAGIDPADRPWYEETGQGQAATLQIANQRRAYTLTDRGTYLSQREQLDLTILFEGAPELLNIYHVIIVNPRKHDDTNVSAARAFAAFLTRADIQARIAAFGVTEFGEPLFFPDALPQ